MFQSIGIDYRSVRIDSISDVIDWLLDGTAVLCFGLYFLIWRLSYDTINTVLMFPSLWLASKLYNLLERIADGRMATREWWEPVKGILLGFLNHVDVVPFKDGQAVPGRHFYSLYDYLLDVDERKRKPDATTFGIIISLVIQFIIIFNIVNVPIPSMPSILWVLALGTIFTLLFSSMFGFVLDTLVGIKHGRLLELMAVVDPNYVDDEEDS